jgi:hypothetical protein
VCLLENRTPSWETDVVVSALRSSSAILGIHQAKVILGIHQARVILGIHQARVILGIHQAKVILGIHQVKVILGIHQARVILQKGGLVVEDSMRGRPGSRLLPLIIFSCVAPEGARLNKPSQHYRRSHGKTSTSSDNGRWQSTKECSGMLGGLLPSVWNARRHLLILTYLLTPWSTVLLRS